MNNHHDAIQSIIYIFNGRFPTEKAHGIQIAKSCEAFAKAGLTVALIVPFRRSRVSDDPFMYYSLDKVFVVKRVWAFDPEWLWDSWRRIGYYVQSVSSYIGITWQLLRMRRGPDSIFYARDYPTLILLTALGFHPVMEIHDYRLVRRRRLIAWALRRTRCLVVNSTGTRDAILKHYNINSKRILVAPNGVDLDFFTIALSKTEARRQLGLPEDAFIIGYTGQREAAGQDKGVDVLEQAFELVKDKIPDAYLCVVGGDRSVPYQQVPFYLRAFDIAVLPLGRGSLAQTTAPMKLFEYCASGSTIIAADAPSLRQYLDESAALFFDRSDPEALSNAIMTVFQDLSLRNRLAEAARLRANSYTWHARAQHVINFIQ